MILSTDTSFRKAALNLLRLAGIVLLEPGIQKISQVRNCSYGAIIPQSNIWLCLYYFTIVIFHAWLALTLLSRCKQYIFYIAMSAFIFSTLPFDQLSFKVNLFKHPLSRMLCFNMFTTLNCL